MRTLLNEACKALEHAARITTLDESTLLTKDYDATDEVGPTASRCRRKGAKVIWDFWHLSSRDALIVEWRAMRSKTPPAIWSADS